MKLRRETLDDLKRSALTHQHAEKMMIKDVAPEQMCAIYNRALEKTDSLRINKGFHVPAYEIPYFDLDGNPNGFARYRLMGDYVPKGAKKSIKYLQLPNTKPQFYLPPFCNWQVIAADPTVAVYFVEGEKKAAALSILGFPAIGLGGVWSWRSRESDDTSDLISDFNLFDWRNRKTVIVFDADV